MPTVENPLVVLITGCDSGIGRAAALALNERGWVVAATVHREEGRAALEQAGVTVFQLDVTDEAAARAVVAEVGERLGGPDAVVANAGRGLFGCFEELHLDEVRSLMEVNLLGAMAVVQPALPTLRDRGGRVVLVSSVAGRLAGPGSTAYSASKFAMNGWGECLRHELAPFGVPVVLVEPGSTDTAFFANRLTGRGVGGSAWAPINARIGELQRALEARRDPVEVAVRGVVRALEHPSPPLHIPTGRGARAQLLAHDLLPWPVYEALARLKLRLPRA